MIEPRYLPVGEKRDALARQGLPSPIIEQIVEVHVLMRNAIGRVSGEIELAYRRGYADGRQAERITSAKEGTEPHG